MVIKRGFRVLAEVVNHLDGRLLRVTDVKVPEQQLSADGELVAVVSTELRAEMIPDGVEIQMVHSSESDRDELEFTITIDVEEIAESNESDKLSESETSVLHVNGDSQIIRPTDVSNHTDRLGAKNDVTNGLSGMDTARTALGTDDMTKIPAYKDPEQLRAVYQEYNTFEEMKEALGVDVSFQTVRRHMIKHGIHTVQSR